MKYLVDILTLRNEADNNIQVWVLNNYYCPDKEMILPEVCVEYNPVPVKKGKDTEFAVDAIRNISLFNEKTFLEAYNNERREMGYKNDNDTRMHAAWNFYHNIKKGDIILLVSKNIVYGYYTVMGSAPQQIESKSSVFHKWTANMTKFANSVEVPEYFGSPFFMKIRTDYGSRHINFKEELTYALIDAINKQYEGTCEV